jgi:hypothetical protein
MEMKTRARERLVKEWMPTSNYWDPIRDMNEAFEIVDIRGFKKLGRTGYNWLVASELTRRIGGHDFLMRRREWFAIKNIQGIEVVLERRVQEYKLLRKQKYE